MRIPVAILLTTALVLTACGGGDNDDVAATAPPAAVATEVTATNTPEVVEPTAEVEETATVSDTTVTEETTTLTETSEMTATETVSDALSELTETAAVTETAPMTATGIMTAPMAQATLMDSAGTPVGDASFTETDEGVIIQVTLRDFTAAAEGEHGIHIHAVGACTPDFQAAGGHFNPTDAMHGMENPDGPHGGDLPNIEVDGDGNAIYQATDAMITLGDGPNSLMDEDGSALVIHADPDDMMTDPSGNSGDRIACGVIEMQ